jgi:hypothetical protein
VSRAPRAAAWLLALSACASLGSPGAGDVDLPTAGAGPFRKLDGDETLGVAPFVLDDRVKLWHDPAALPVDAAGEGGAVFLYVAGTIGGRESIVRTRADDGRSFFGASVGTTPAVVLQADSPAEHVRAPSAVRVGGQVLLYWADGAGVRVATSADGLAFAKKTGYALAAAPAGAWETSPPDAPSVAVYPDGRIRMVYAAGGELGEAESADGLTFTRLGDAPIFGPSVAPDPATLAPGQKPPFDDARVGDPCVAPRVTPAGRLHIRVLYTGTDTAGVTSIGLAARYGDSGPLARQTQPVYAVGKGEKGPALFEWSGGSLLYVAQDRAPTSDTHYDAIAAAFAPANLRLPAATTYADSP